MFVLKRLTRIVIALVCMAIVASTTFGVIAQAPIRGGTAIVGTNRDILRMDPHLMTAVATYQVMGNIYEGLIAYDSDFNPVPQLAESWSSSPDGTRWTFNLRKGVRFHNDRPLTAADVKYSIERICNPKTASPRPTAKLPLKEITVVDDYTVELVLNQPYSAMLYRMDFKNCAIVPREEVEKHGDLNLHPVGTGPFRFVEWIPMTHVVLEKNEEYWGEPAYLDKVIFKVIPEDFTRTSALKKGEIDLLIGVPPQLVSDLKQNPELSFGEAPGTGVRYMGLNCARPPFSDVRIRQAINFAIDRQLIIQAAMFGAAVPAYHNIPPASPFALDLRLPKRDINKAKSLLAEAGYENGFEVEINVLGGFSDMQAAGETVQDQLRALNINLKPIPTEPGIYESRVVGKRDYDACITGSSEGADPSLRLENYFMAGAPYNVSDYVNPKVDDILTKAQQAKSKEEAEKYYTSAVQIIMDEAPWIPLYSPNTMNAWRKTLHGFEVNKDQLTFFRNVWISK
jgi:peptide/nickel transport system substrate-binding protein